MNNEYSNRTELHDGDVMPWGKHKGKTLGEVPDHYWQWFAKQDWAQQHPALLEYANLTEIEGNEHGQSD